MPKKPERWHDTDLQGSQKFQNNFAMLNKKAISFQRDVAALHLCRNKHT